MGTGVVPVQAHALCDGLDDAEIEARLSRRTHRRLTQLDHAIGVAYSAQLFGPSGSRQDDIGQPSGLGHEDVLNHQVRKRCKRVPRVVEIGVAHCGVFAHHVHATNFVGIILGCQHLVHHLNHRVTWLIVQRGTPERFKPRMGLWVGHALIVGIHHRDQTGVACALHVVLSTKRMQARAGFTNLPGHRDQGNQATHVVRAVHVLAHTHAPQHHRALGRCERARHVANGVSRDAANGRHRLWAIAFNVGDERVVVFSAGGNEVRVD